MLRFAVFALVLATLVHSPSSASAGSLDEFRDSVDRNNTPRRSRPDSNRTSRAPDHDDETSRRGSEFGALLMRAVFVGDTPGPRFSWGASPYRGRGFVESHKLAIVGDLSRAASRQHRPGHFQGRLEGLSLTDGSAMGFGVFAKVESTHSPAFSVWHQQLLDFGASDRLGVTNINLEPRIATLPLATLFWSTGAAILRSEEGLVNAGGSVGMGLTLTPVDPLFFEMRFSAQIMPGLAIGDVYLSGGVEVSDGVFALVGYRGLIGPTAPLHTATVGLQVDLGFGGRRRTQSASTTAPAL